jgi:hypothetical protein
MIASDRCDIERRDAAPLVRGVERDMSARDRNGTSVVSVAEDLSVSSAALDRHPLQEPAGLDVKESAELVEGIGMEAAETASGAGEPIRAGVSQVRALTEFIGCDATRRHEFVHSESHHNTFRVEPRTPYGTALRYTALQYTVYVVQ